MYPFNHKMGQKLQTDSNGVVVDRGFIAHLNIAAANAIATSATGVLASTILTAETQAILAGITSPAIPRALSVVGNVAGITGNVVIKGINYANEAITETLALNGTTTVNGAKAFKAVTEIDLPVKVHSGVAQVETATAAGSVSTAGNVSVVVTAAGMTGSPKTISVPVLLNDNASAIALAIRTALAADSAVTALFAVSGATDKIILTALIPAANDATLNISIANGTSAGVTTAATSADTTAGVVYDKVSIGWSDVLGLPYKLTHNTVLATYVDNALETTAATVTVSATAIESNTIDPNTALSGKVIDVYLIV